MTDIAAGQAPLPDLFATTAKSVRLFAWSDKAKPLQGLAGWLKGILYVFIFAQIVNMLILATLTWVFYAWQSAGNTDEPVTGMVAFVTGTAAQLMPIGLLVVFVACGFLYLRFVYRAAKNLQLSKATNFDISPGAAVWWSFVPFVQLGMIFKVMKEIWINSADPQKAKIDAPSTLVWWWGLWLAAGVLNRISEYMAGPGTEIDPLYYFDQFLPAAIVNFGGIAAAIISTILLLGIVSQIARAQESLRASAVFQD